jgi:hypothetical protein
MRTEVAKHTTRITHTWARSVRAYQIGEYLEPSLARPRTEERFG